METKIKHSITPKKGLYLGIQNETRMGSVY